MLTLELEPVVDTELDERIELELVVTATDELERELLVIATDELERELLVIATDELERELLVAGVDELERLLELITSFDEVAQLVSPNGAG